MADLINVLANDPLLMDAALERSGCAFRRLMPPERALLPGKEADFLQHFSGFIAVCPQLEHDSQDGDKNRIAIQSRFQVNCGTFSCQNLLLGATDPTQNRSMLQ